MKRLRDAVPSRSRCGLRLGVVFLLLAFSSTLHAQSSDLVELQPTERTGNAGIVGRVVDGRTNAPLQGVEVKLGVPGAHLRDQAGIVLFESRRILTNSDGRFAFSALPEGVYGIGASLDGWRQGEYGARRPGEPGRALTLAAGGRVNVTIVL